MKVKLSLDDFKALIDATKNFVEKDNLRPILEFICIRVKKDSIEAVSCDGCQCSRFTLQQENAEEFITHIRPIPMRQSRGAVGNVTIEAIDNKAIVTMPTGYGEVSYSFTQPVEEYKLDTFVDIIQEAIGRADRVVTVNANKLKATAQAFINFNAEICSGKHSPVNIFSGADNTKPLLFTSRCGDKMSIEHILLPIRTAEPVAIQKANSKEDASDDNTCTIQSHRHENGIQYYRCNKCLKDFIFTGEVSASFCLHCGRTVKEITWDSEVK